MHLDFIGFDVVVNAPEQLFGHISPTNVDASVHRDVLLFRHLPVWLDVVVVQVGVQHNDGESHDVRSIFVFHLLWVPHVPAPGNKNLGRHSIQ